MCSKSGGKKPLNLSEFIQDLQLFIGFEYPGWEIDTPLQAEHYFKFNSTAAELMPSTMCQTQTFLLVIVFSLINNFGYRRAIRQTWGSKTKIHSLSVKHYFLVGATKNQTIQVILHSPIA